MSGVPSTPRLLHVTQEKERNDAMLDSLLVG